MTKCTCTREKVCENCETELLRHKNCCFRKDCLYTKDRLNHPPYCLKEEDEKLQEQEDFDDIPFGRMDAATRINRYGY